MLSAIKTPHFLHAALLRVLGDSVHKTFTEELVDISRLWDLNEQKVEELLYLSSGLVFGVLEVKDDLHRIRKVDKIWQKLRALERGPGCTSWIYNNWTAGLTAGNTYLSH